MTAGWGETEVPMDVSSRRLAPVQHRHLPARGLLSLFSLLRGFLLTVIKRNQAILMQSCTLLRAGYGYGYGAAMRKGPVLRSSTAYSRARSRGVSYRCAVNST